ncbi:MAG: hypothetical protein GXO40_01280 [Epsilonproteobacteria bacterium]|nr:hypothetical protein [Campylobacterota bacterium]
MKYLKSHLFLIFALVSILFSIETYLIFNKIVSSYEQKIVKNYTVIVVSKTPIKQINFPYIDKITPINIQNSLANIQKQLKGFDINKLKAQLPYFYKLHFKSFPSPKELNRLERTLMKNPNIKRIESFRISQHQTYNLLLMTKLIATIFMVIILFIAFLLITKQLEVWRFEHSERMYIMELFGAPFWFRSAILLKLAIVDSILSIVLIFFIIEYIINSRMYQDLLSQLQINIEVNIWANLAMFFGISLSISLLSTFIVIMSKKDEVL